LPLVVLKHSAYIVTLLLSIFRVPLSPQARGFVGIAASIPVLTLARNAALHTATSIPEISLPPFPRNNFT